MREHGQDRSFAPARVFYIVELAGIQNGLRLGNNMRFYFKNIEEYYEEKRQREAVRIIGETLIFIVVIVVAGYIFIPR